MRKKLFFLFFLINIAITLSSIFAEDENSNWTEEAYASDFVYFIINELDLTSFEIIDMGIFGNDIFYSVYRINYYVIITISVDEDGFHYIVGNVASNEAMRDILDMLTIFYSEPVPFLDGDGFTAFFHDIEGELITDNLADYIGTFTLSGHLLFVEEVLAQERFIVQRQWSTPDFFETSSAELGEGWGFIASWAWASLEEDEIVTVPAPEIPAQVILPAQFTVRLWRDYGDSLSSIAGMPFIYGDPFQWRILFEANRDRLPNRNNPHLIFPDTVLDIPSIDGELRYGMWNWDSETYEYEE